MRIEFCVSLLAILGLTSCARDSLAQPSPMPGGTEANYELYAQRPRDETLSLRYSETTSAAADDFVVPDGELWSVWAVGLEGEAQAESLSLLFYGDAAGVPGAQLARYDDLPYIETQKREGRNLYLVPLPQPLGLSSGGYWMGLYFPQGAEFFWREFDRRAGEALLISSDGVHWRGPGEISAGTCCDLSFSLIGSSQPEVQQAACPSYEGLPGRKPCPK